MIMDHRSNNPSDSCGVLTGFNTVSHTGIIKVNSYVLQPNPHPNRKKRLSTAVKGNSYRLSVDPSALYEDGKVSDNMGTGSEFQILRNVNSRMIPALTSGHKTINDDQIDYSAQERELDIAEEMMLIMENQQSLQRCPMCN